MKDRSLKVASVVPMVRVADCDYNTDSIIEICNKLNVQGVRLAVFPELSITGFTCGDLFHSEVLINGCERSLKRLVDMSLQWEMAIIVGGVISHNEDLYDCGLMILQGEIVVAVPNHSIDRNGCFSSGKEIDEIVQIANQSVPLVSNRIVSFGGLNISIIVGEKLNFEALDSLSEQLDGVSVIVNLSAQNEIMGAYQCQVDSIKNVSKIKQSVIIYSGAGYGESTTDDVYDGKAIIAANGNLLAINKRWQTTEQIEVANIRSIDFVKTDIGNCRIEKNEINANPFLPVFSNVEDWCRDAVNIQIMGLMRRLDVTHCKNLVIGISGGLDSTLALLVAVKTFDRIGLDRKGIIGVTMPGFGTTDRTYNNALVMMQSLGITVREISIVNAVKQHFEDINHDISIHDVTYENAQARERTQILMDIANQVGGMVLGTGDMSELALGWATYNGDHMSMYGINAGVPKTLVRRLVRYIAEGEDDERCQKALIDVIDTPISPELVPADKNGNIKQKTEDLVGPYELHDFFLYYVLKKGYGPRRIYEMAQGAFDGIYDGQTIKHWLNTFFRRFFNQQFKRSCMPDGPNVCGISLSPRGAWHMPSDASSALWLKECNEL